MNCLFPLVTFHFMQRFMNVFNICNCQDVSMHLAPARCKFESQPMMFYFENFFPNCFQPYFDLILEILLDHKSELICQFHTVAVCYPNIFLQHFQSFIEEPLDARPKIFHAWQCDEEWWQPMALFDVVIYPTVHFLSFGSPVPCRSFHAIWPVR